MSIYEIAAKLLILNTQIMRRMEKRGVDPKKDVDLILERADLRFILMNGYDLEEELDSGSINDYSLIKADVEEKRKLAAEFNIPIWFASQAN